MLWEEPFPDPAKPQNPQRIVTEAEGSDRVSLDLPGRQLELVQAFVARGGGVALGVVLLHGGPVDVSWMKGREEVAAIVSAGFPGQVREVGGGLGGLEHRIDLEERRGRDIREGWYCMGGGWWQL